jgi:hypothetical protein
MISMNDKVYEELSKKFGEKRMARLQEFACQSHPELVDTKKFKEWVVDYVIDSFIELYDEHVFVDLDEED